MTQPLDLDALQAELDWYVEHGLTGPRERNFLRSLQDLIGRLCKADAALTEVRALIPQRMGAEHMRERLQSITRRAAPDSTPTDSADSEGKN